MQDVLQEGFQYTKAIEHTRPEFNSGGFIKITRANGDFFNLKIMQQNLGDNLRIEYEPIAI